MYIKVTLSHTGVLNVRGISKWDADLSKFGTHPKIPN